MHAKLQKPLIAAAKDLLPGFTGTSVDDVAAHLGIKRRALEEAMPEYVARFPFDQADLFLVLLGLFRSKRIRELIGASSDTAARKIAAKCNSQERWDALVHGDKLVASIQSLARSVAAGESIPGQTLLDLIALTQKMSLPFLEEAKIADMFGQIDESMKKCGASQRKIFRDVLGSQVEQNPELLVDVLVGSLIQSIGLDEAQYDAVIGRYMTKKSFDSSTFSTLLTQRLDAPGGVAAVKKHYLAMLPRVAKNAPEKLVEPPPAIIDDVLEPTFSVVLLWLSELREADNFWLVGSTLGVLLGQNTDSAKAGAGISKVLQTLSDDDLSAFVDAVSHIELFDKKCEKQMEKTLHAGLEPILAARSVRWSKRGATVLKKLKLVAGAPLTLPKELPQTEDAAFAFLTARVAAFKKAKPAKDVPTDLPASLSAFYARASHMAPHVDKPKALAQLGKSLRSWLKDAEEEDEDSFSEGVAPDKLSPRKQWCVFGKDESGDFFFMDPARGELVFRYRHDESIIEAEAQSLWAFVAYFGANDWAEEEGLGREWLDRIIADRKRAAKACKAK